MLKIELNFQKLYDVINKMRKDSNEDFLLEISESCPFSENLLAFKIIKLEAKKLGRKAVFNAQVPPLNALAEVLNEDTESFGFVRDFDIAPTHSEANAPRINLLSVITSFLRSKLSFNRDIGFIIAVVAGTIILVFYLLIYYLPKATLTLSVEAESLAKSIEVIASPSAQRVEASSSSLIIPAIQISSVGKRNATAPATGTKEIGDKAKGEVTIYNKTENSKTLSPKTPLYKGRTQGADLVFLTDDELLVPPRSGEISGAATVSATAEKIGDEYNITTNNTLSVSTFSTNTLIAENNRGFSGGSRRQITVVTEEDQKKLLASVEAELENSLVGEIRSKLLSDQKIEDSSLAFTDITKTFDRSVSEEASAFNLVLEEKVTALVYSENDLKSILNDTLKNYVPHNYNLFGEDRKIEITTANYVNGNLIFSTNVKGFIIPKIDDQKIIDDIVGLKLSAAKQYLGSIPAIKSFQINNFPNIPLFEFMPRNKKSIRVLVVRK